MNRRSSFILILCLLVSITFSIRASASADFKSAPSNFELLKSTLGESLAIVNCGLDYGVGFAGNWNLSQDQKNQGINTLFFTSKTLVDKCQGSYRSLIPGGTAKYKNKDYDIKKWGWNLDGTDFATVASSVNVPTLDLYSNIFPDVGWWVVVAYYVPGFGIAFKESRVQLLDKEQFVLGIDSFTPAPIDDGVVFDNKGSFLGIVTKLGNPIPSGLLKVHGAPRQCNVSGVSGATITNCSVSREKVWSSISSSTTPSPKPSPSKSAVDSSIAAYDAFNAAVDSYNLGKIAKSDCVKAYQSSNTPTRRILNLVSGIRICSSQDVLVNAAYQRLLSLDPGKTTVRDPLVLIDRLNEITGQFDLFAEVMDEATIFAEELRDSAYDLSDVEALIGDLETLSSSLGTVLERLPSKIKNLLYSKVEVAAFIDLNNRFLETREEFKDALSQFSGSSDVDFEALDDFKSSINLASRLFPSEVSMNDIHTNALKVIPNFYCKKGKALSLPLKGKCSSGSSKIKIDKTW